jgi:hypothetical protein
MNVAEAPDEKSTTVKKTRTLYIRRAPNEG